VTLLPCAAWAQQATALDRLQPAPAGDGSFAVPRADVPGHLRPAFALALSYADAPLSLRSSQGSARRDVGDVVRYQLVAHLLASVELFQRAKVDLDVPATLAQAGNSPVLDGRAFTSPAGAAMNDLRLGLRVEVLRQHGAFPAASVAYALWLPTGNDSAYTGTGKVRHAPSLVVGAAMDRWRWSATLGYRLQDRADGLLGGELFGGLGAAARFGPITAQAELFGATTTAEPLSRGTTSLELLVGGRYALGPFWLGLGVGPGLTRGAGTPRYRVLASVGATFGKDERQPAQRPEDEAARTAGTAGKGGIASTNAPAPVPAAPPDSDGDGVPDAEDACPTRIGDAKPGAARRGCPPDGDADGIPDADDRCPDQAGVASADPARYGCPPDSDGDGIIDARDACPGEKGPATDDPKTSGCPAAVRVEGTQIVILQQVNFATGKDVIEQDSYPLLEQVAGVLKEHPEIARVAIEGHTDNRGAEKANVTLSERRAIAVVKWLADHGIDARRLEAHGYGPRRPIAKNDSEEGRAKNRRVEFQILKKTPLGQAGWKEGAAR
jgi:outer membrane protein OmpA-like peptidoglycan-associated protein